MDRCLAIDIIKVFGTISVVMGHMNTPYVSFIYVWHMPLFFFIAGLGIKNSDISQSIKKDFVRLVVPFFIFSIIGYIVETLKRFALGRSFFQIEEWFYANFIFLDSSLKTYGFVLWFLPALFWSKVIFRFFLRFKIKKSVYLFFICLSLHVALFYTKAIASLPMGIGFGIIGIIYISMGHVYSLTIRNLSISKSYLITTLSVMLMIVLVYFQAPLPHVNFGVGEFTFIGLGFLWPTLILLTFTLILNPLFLLESTKNFNNLAKVTMLVFIFHPYTNNISYLFVEYFMFPRDTSWMFQLVGSFLVLLPLCLMKIKQPNWGILKYV